MKSVPKTGTRKPVPVRCLWGVWHAICCRIFLASFSVTNMDTLYFRACLWKQFFFGTGFRRWFLVRVSCESRPDWPVVRAFSREALSCLTLISHQQAACMKKFQSRNAATAVSTCKRTKRIRKKSLVNYKLYQKAAIIPVQPVQVHALQAFYLWVTSFGTPLKRKPELNAVDVIPHQRLHGRPQQQYCHIKPPPLYATKLRTFLNE